MWLVYQATDTQKAEYVKEKNNYFKENKKINDNALITLILLMVMSNSKEKDNLIKIATNFLK